jgi:hypothetical protein
MDLDVTDSASLYFSREIVRLIMSLENSTRHALQMLQRKVPLDVWARKFHSSNIILGGMNA